MHFVNKNTGKLININPKFAGVVAELLRHPGYRLANDADFKETDHPRDKDGKFTSGGGSAKSLTEKSSGIRESLKSSGVKARTRVAPGGGEVQVIAPTYESRFSKEEQKKILETAKENGFTFARGVEIDPNEYLEDKIQFNFYPGSEKKEEPAKEKTQASVGRLSKRTHEQGQHLKGKLLQTDINRLQPGQRQEFVDMYEKAAAAKDSFDEKNAKIAKEVGGTAAIVPLKGSTRAVDKILGDYDGDPSQIKDLLRTTIEIKDLSEVDNVLAKLGENYSIEEKGFRNLLKEGTDSLGGSGYRDMKMNVKIDGVMAEVQVNFPQMLKAKEKMHGHYEEISEILRSASKTKGIMTKEDNERIAQLNQEMKDVYDAAWAEIISAKSS